MSVAELDEARRRVARQDAAAARKALVRWDYAHSDQGARRWHGLVSRG